MLSVSLCVFRAPLQAVKALANEKGARVYKIAQIGGSASAMTSRSVLIPLLIGVRQSDTLIAMGSSWITRLRDRATCRSVIPLLPSCAYLAAPKSAKLHDRRWCWHG
jgi:hypothetical protein